MLPWRRVHKGFISVHTVEKILPVGREDVAKQCLAVVAVPTDELIGGLVAGCGILLAGNGRR